MNCRYCGTVLPDEALFCPECGRAVNVNISASAHADAGLDPTPVAVATGVSIADLAFSSPSAGSDPLPVVEKVLPDGTALDEHQVAARCPQCGEPMADGEVFCGECGFVVRTVAPPSGGESGAESPESNGSLPTSIIVLPDLIRLGHAPAHSAEQPAADAAVGPVVDARQPTAGLEGPDTTEVDPVVFGALDALPVEPVVDAADADVAADVADVVVVDPAPTVEEAEETPIDELVHETPAQLAAAARAVVSLDPDLEFDEPLPFALPIAKKPTASPRSRPIPDPFPWGTDRPAREDAPLREDIEATRLISDTASGNRYVLQFSTGESVIVLGSGLVGRNPSMQPGEYVDQLVPIFDAGKSVSKTHLEYGQEAGRFWISDRYSTNGSTIRQPDAEPRRADPGRRYFIARGTRVDLGEQFFVVS